MHLGSLVVTLYSYSNCSLECFSVCIHSLLDLVKTQRNFSVIYTFCTIYHKFGLPIPWCRIRELTPLIILRGSCLKIVQKCPFLSNFIYYKKLMIRYPFNLLLPITFIRVFLYFGLLPVHLDCTSVFHAFPCCFVRISRG